MTTRQSLLAFSSSRARRIWTRFSRKWWLWNTQKRSSTCSSTTKTFRIGLSPWMATPPNTPASVIALNQIERFARKWPCTLNGLPYSFKSFTLEWAGCFCFIFSFPSQRDWCVELHCEFYLYVEASVHLENVDTLRLLIEQNRPIVGPLLKHVARDQWNFLDFGDPNSEPPDDYLPSRDFVRHRRRCHSSSSVVASFFRNVESFFWFLSGDYGRCRCLLVAT